MLTAEVYIVIPGAPAPKGSMKCLGRRGPVRHALVDSLPTTKPWQELVTGWVKSKWPSHQHAVKHQPVGAEVAVTVKRPDYHYGTGRNAHTIKPRYVDARPVEHGTGDLDKYARGLLDAMQAAPGVLPDDAAVVELVARKFYVAPERAADVLPWPGVVIRLYPI